MSVKKIYVKFSKLILYGIIGCFSSGVDFCIYTLIVKVFQCSILLANSISVLSGITTSFYLNRRYNFKVKDRMFRRFFLFLSIGLAGLLLSNAILYVLIVYYHIDEIVAKVLSIIFVAIVQFCLNRYITFKSVK